MAVGVFDHPVLSGLLGDEEVAACFCLRAELAAMIRFEIALAQAEAAEGAIPAQAGEAIAGALATFEPDVAALRAATIRDGVAVPDLVRQMRAFVPAEHADHVHFGATSQDVIDTGLALRLLDALAIIRNRTQAVIERLEGLEARQGDRETMAHTRMQAAIPVPASRKIASWREPLIRHRARLDLLGEQIAILHFGGAAGTLDKLGEAGAGVARRLAEALGLNPVPHARHSERDGPAALASVLSLLTGSLGKMGQDIALLAQTEIGEIRLSEGGGSSAMPHKVNPVGAEVLVAQARFNATLVSGMHHAMVHENERSGAAWTLEWMILPQMVVATAGALSTAARLLETVEFSKPDGP